MQDKKSGVQQRNRVLVYAGTTFWIAWSVQILVFSGRSSFLAVHPAHPWLAGALVAGYVGGAAALLFWGRRLFSQCRLSSLVMGLSVACVALGVMESLSGVVGLPPSFPLLVVLGALMLVITILWMCIVCVRSTAGLYGSMGATTAVGTVVGFCLNVFAGSMAGAVASAIVLVASLVCLVFATDSTLGADTMLVPQGEGVQNEKAAPFPPMALAAGALVWAVLGFTVVLWTHGSPFLTRGGVGTFSQNVLVACGIAGAAGVFALVGLRYRNADKLGFAVLGLVVACVGTGLYMFQGMVFPGSLVVVMLAAGFTFFHLYGKVLNLDLSFQAAESPLVTFAQASTVDYAAALVGGLLAAALPLTWLELPLVSVVVLVLLFLLIFANATFFSRKNIGTRWGLVARQASLARDDQIDEAAAERGQFLAAAETVARTASLTPREHEVFVLLVQGYRAKQIESALGISLGTVRNHINHAYMKLGVHSYDEARLLVEDEVHARLG